jgi:UDP-glucose 4-epimerase
VVRELSRRGCPSRRAVVPWTRSDEAVRSLENQARDVAAEDRPWRIIWCAGAGVIGTTQRTLDQEVHTFAAFLDRLSSLSEVAPAPDAVVLASSAGGIYGGSQAPPFTEATEPVPISPYGEAKLEAEERLRSFAAHSGVPVVIGRLSNLYGPGQDLSKPQGLISQLCQAHHERRPLSIFVSLDTARDYLFSDDAARMLTRAADRAAACPPATVVVKILASQRPTTVATILGELRRLLRHRPLVVLGTSPLATFHARDLRFRSRVWTDLDRFVTTTLPEGIWSTMEDLRHQARQPVLVPDPWYDGRTLDG